jgi:hypothetical protein
VTSPDRQHLSDERLIETYFARAGDGAAPAEVESECEHVRTCDACARRYERLTASLERLREQALAEADAYFTADRLAAQRDRVMRHLEGVEHPARVIPFPHHTTRPRAARVHAPLVRWVAAAAAAGLLIGVSAGRLLYVRPRVAPPAVASVQVRATDPAINPSATVYDGVARSVALEEEFLSEFEDALSEQRVAALRAIDALTPRARDLVVSAK